MPTIFDEGQLRFTFPNHWYAVQYDATNFYRHQIIPTGANLKAVDFIAVPHPDHNQILMIEVKDFRGHAAENDERIVSGDLVSEIIEKAMHTLSGLYIVKYYNNAELANYVADALTPPAKIELVLFMEEDAVIVLAKNDTKGKLRKLQKEQRIDDMVLSLRQKLKNTVGIRTKVLNTERIEARDGFTVTHIP